MRQGWCNYDSHVSPANASKQTSSMVMGSPDKEHRELVT
jgi:hypothetical protein